MFKLIASYPKSGNTYVRIFLAHYLRGETSLNKTGWPIFSSRHFFPLGVRRRGIRPFDTEFIAKTHECGDAFSRRYCESAVYIIRNPLDVAPSYARHMNISIDRAIKAMACPSNTLSGTEKIYPQKIGSWTSNVTSWLAVREFPVCVLRYETLLANPAHGFRLILNHFNFPIVEPKFSESLEYTRFENLKAKEEKEGFQEARGSTGKFFNVGKSGQWKTALTVEQIRSVLSNHGELMEKLGYTLEPSEHAIAPEKETHQS